MSEEKMVRTSFRLPKKLLKQVKIYAVNNDKSDTQVFTEALKQYLEKKAEQ